MTYEHVTVERKGPLAVIAVNRPKALNALNAQVITELILAVSELEDETGIRAVALTGAGDKAFIAGADIAEMKSMTPLQAQAFAELGGALGDAIAKSRMPYIAAVDGFALGGGCEVALACDFIYASDKARFGQPEVKLGVIPGFGGTQRLARRVGVAKCKELVFTGDMIKADEALRIGLCDKIVASDELMAVVESLAERIAANGPLAVATSKRVIQDGLEAPLTQGMLIEQIAFGSLFATADQSEGMDAFVSKRTAEFVGQ